MAYALNLVLEIRQDQATQEKLSTIVRTFSERLQPEIEKVFRQSGVIHFARVFVIDRKYLVVIAEYDGPRQEYTEFFRRALSPVFEIFFSIAKGVPDDVTDNAQAFFDFVRSANIRSLGNLIDGDADFDGKSDWIPFFSLWNPKCGGNLV